MSGLYTHSFSPARTISPHIRNTPDVDSQYLAELLVEHQKLGPFTQVLPTCSRLLNQEIMRVSGVPSQGFADYDRLQHRCPSPIASPNIVSNTSVTGSSGWSGLYQEKPDFSQGTTMDWQGAPASPSSHFVKKILRLEIPVDNYPNFNFVGRLLGPRGNSLKRVEASTGCRVFIRGKGSIKDPGKEEKLMGRPGYEHLNDPLHVLIEAELPAHIVDLKLRHAQEILEELLKPVDLGIARISKSLLEVAKRESKQLKIHTIFKAKKLLETSELRRSSRMQKEAPSYCDDVVDSGKRRLHCRRSCKSESIGREYTGRIASYEEKVFALKRAEMLLAQVSSDHPSFVKSMLRSHVSSCFWLGLPTKFCRDHLPLCETKMILEDEEGEEHEAIYIGRRTGLSGGWRSFAVDHKLEDGDALVFKLIELTRFKIYIVKAIAGSTEANYEKALFGDPCAFIESKETEDSPCENQSFLITNQAPKNKSEELPRNARKRKQSNPKPSYLAKA